MEDFSVDLIFYSPKDFRRKEINEPFIQNIMARVLREEDWVKGDPHLLEPDYFCKGTPFEFTIASDKKKKNNFIEKLYSSQYTSDNVEDDVIGYLSVAIEKKAKKHYSMDNVHLCVLCLLDLTIWVEDQYGSITYDLISYRRTEFFKTINDQYISSGKFANVFLIFPDMDAKWWVWDVLSGHRASIPFSDEDILSGKYPYIITKERFEKIK